MMGHRWDFDVDIGLVAILYYFVRHFSLRLGEVPFQTVVHDRSVFGMHLLHVHHVLSEALLHYFVNGFAWEACGGVLH
jgi:hypothetical protein